MLRITVLVVLGGLCASVLSIHSANAVTFDVLGATNAGNTATIDFTYDGLDTITIEITNNGTFGDDPMVTGFAFNLPDTITGLSPGPSGFSASATGLDSAWSADFDENMVGTPQDFGLFDIAAFVTPNFQGGNPNSGIATGETGIFTFGLTGDGLNALTASSFLNLLSVSNNGGVDETLVSFAVRFQQTGIDGEGSDVAVATVPLPGAAWLFGTAVVWLVGFSRRGQKSPASGGPIFSQNMATA